MRKVFTNCQHYVGDRPCKPHKKDGVFCEACSYYQPISSRILLIKLGATGDVLRTTATLAALRKAYPHAHITWVTKQPCIDLIQYNPHLNRALVYDAPTLAILLHESFDLCINLDLGAEAAGLASQVKAKAYKGFGLGEDGTFLPCNPAAETVMEMSLWDDIKKANQKTYQELMAEIIESSDSAEPIFVPLLDESLHKAKRFFAENGLRNDRPIIGLNIGAGDRWQHKKWTQEGYLSLAEHLYKQLNVQIIILYGPVDEKRAHQLMAKMSVPHIDGKLHSHLLDFVAILDLCDLVVTGDTLALHIALGLNKKVVCLVGPTSAQELEMYGVGVILQGEIDCLGCYLTQCDKDPHCMSLLKPETVFKAVKEVLYGECSQTYE